MCIRDSNRASNYLISGAEPKRYGNGHPNICPYDFTHVAKLRIIPHSKIEPPVTRLHRIVRADVGMAVTVPLGLRATDKIVAGSVDHPSHLGVQQRDVAVLPLACTLPFLQSSQDGDSRVHGRRHVHYCQPYFHGRALHLTGDAHDSTPTLHGKIIARLFLVRSRLPVTGYGTVDQPRVDLA